MNSSECSSGCESGWTLYLEQSFHDCSPNNSNPHTAYDINNNNSNKKKKKKGKFLNYKEKISNGTFCKEKDDDETGEEEDLSMVSDASSGPPHFHDDYHHHHHICNEEEEEKAYFCINGRYNQYPTATATSKANNNGGKRQKMKQEMPALLDDTASSPVLNFSSKNDFTLNNNQASMESVLDDSQAFSATHFQGRSSFQDGYFGFYQSSHSGKHLQNNQWS